VTTKSPWEVEAARSIEETVVGEASPMAQPEPQIAPLAPSESHAKTSGSGNTGSSKSGVSHITLPQVSSASQQSLQPVDANGEPEVGARVHHYELIKQIGRGGMGTVYLARDTRLGRKVAIKFLRTQSAELTRRFILEARTTAACQHENIVIIFEVDAWRGSPFMVFEFLEGQTLSKVAPNDKVHSAPRSVELVVPVVRALAYAHSQGVVHRDLKPDNIIITDSGLTKVLDFGIAKVLQDEDPNTPAALARPRAPKNSLEDETNANLTQHGAMMGTLAYMAPEQWGIGVSIDHRADIWAVGILLFRLLTGKHPLYPMTGHELMVTGMLDKPMPKVADISKDVPAELAAIVDKCLLKRKEQRWPDAVSLLRALEPFLPGRYSKELRIDESPYAGLSAFQESDANRFFGRSQEVAATVNRLKERPLLGIVGPSGAGKSSFVRAGLVPALKRVGEGWESMVLRPGRNPMESLASLIAPMVSTSVSMADELEEQKKLAQRLALEPGLAGAALRARARREKKNILLFVDQFEELYTLVGSADERKAFTSALSGIADDATSPIRLVLSIRSDFLDRVTEDPRFMAELNQGLVFLAAPGKEGLRDALTEPAEMAGYKFESSGIIDDMIDHLATTPGALPLLQFTATKLWESRDPARKLLTQSAYKSLGGVSGALSSHADAVLQKMTPQAFGIARGIFLRLVTEERTRAIVSMEELRDIHSNALEVHAVVDDLVQARLLVVQTSTGGPATVEIVHESLISGWPTLKKWLEESGDDAAFLEQVRNASRQWQAKGQEDDLLWRGELAEEAARFRRKYKGNLNQIQELFLDSTIDLTARQVKRKRNLMFGAVAFLSLLVAAAGVALVQIRSARDDAQDKAQKATLAQADALKNLESAQRKEKERALAADAAQKANLEAQEANAKLREKQNELMDALKNAESAAEAARVAEQNAKSNASAALVARKSADDARSRADKARKDVADLLEKEKERASRLEEQLGSTVIDTLK
jgi:eukaryotic-like serine/threonine-protein kinase